MKYLISRAIHALLTAAILALALYVLLILFVGGQPFTAYGLKIKILALHLPVILLLVLVILRFPLGHHSFSREVFFSHAGTILFSVFLIVYLANGTTTDSGDTAPARHLPLSILREGNFDLDEFPFLYARGTPKYLRLVKGHYVSDYPVGAALLALPFYLPSALGHINLQRPFLMDLEKLSAATIVAFSAVILYFALRRLTSGRMALLITAVYALGTSSLSTSSQALWQHGPSQLALTATLYCLVRGRRDPPWVAFAGLPLAFAVVSRPTDLLIALPVGTYVLLHHRQQVGGFLLGGLPPVLFHFWYNTTYFDHPLRTQLPILGSELWATAFWEGLTGILVSPGRGLFVYSPIFLLSVLGIGLAWRRNGDPLLRYLSIGALLTIMLYSGVVWWWGGHCYGPRYMADITPILALCLYPLDGSLQKSRALNWVFIMLMVWSVGAHSIGAFWNDHNWNVYMAVDRFPQRLWSWTDNQLVNPPSKLFHRATITMQGLPTSRIAPDLLSASYRVNLPPTVTTSTAQPIRFMLEATNEGQAVWLGWPLYSEGIVKLRWRWLTGDEEIPGMSREKFLLYDVFPQQTHQFWTSIDPPQEPGIYFLEVGLITKSAVRSSDLPTPPIRLTVKVEPPPLS